MPSLLARRPPRSAVAPVLLILAACGARSSLGSAAAGGGEPGAAAPDPPTEPPPRDAFRCARTTDPRPMLAARVNDGLHFAFPDRSVREVHRFDVPADGYVVNGGVVARGDRVASYVVVAPLGSDSTLPPRAELVVVGVDGVVHVHERFDFAYDGWGSDSTLYGHADGTFVLTLLEIQAALGVVVRGDGTRVFTETMAGRSDPDAGGAMLVADYEASSSVAFHFHDTRTGTFAPSRYWQANEEGRAASSAAAVDAGIVYLDRDPWRLVHEDARGVTEAPLVVDLDPSAYASPGWQRSGGWVLFHLDGETPEGARYLAARPSTGEQRGFSLAPPAPWQLPVDVWNPPAIDALGRVLVVVGSGRRQQVLATRDGRTWEPLGLPMVNEGYPSTLIEAGGAIVFRGRGSGEPTPDTLPGWASQLVGPQGGEGVVLDRAGPDGAPDNPSYGDDTLSPDGRCLAYFRGGSVHVVETDTYAVEGLALASTTQSAELAWIPIQRGD